jgi:cytochrome b561
MDDRVIKRNKIPSALKFGITAGLSFALLPMIAQAAPVSPSTPAGWLPNFESLIALMIVLTAALIAWLLNHARPKKRALGTFLSALSCFGIVAWFVGALSTGVIENPKTFQMPMDAAKPALLWIQTLAALLGGLALLIVANGQRKQTDTLDLAATNEVERYGRVSRILHWTTAILFIFMIPTGIFASMIPENVWFRTEYNAVHKTIGLIIFGLVIARLIWNWRSKRPKLDSSLKPLDRKLAHSAHVLLYILMIGLPLTGYLMTSFHGYETAFFMFGIPSFLPESDAYILWGLFHKYILQYLVYLILGAHILGVLKHHFIDKHKTAINRMVG